jgi:sugar (pentulose or hexulose) kinase
MWILALDVGTSSIRAIGYDALGLPLPGADALGVPIEVREGTEALSRGAALLTLGALGRPAPPPEPSGTQVRPDPRRCDVYAAARPRQGRLYESVVGPRVS